jgi:DNA recombination protein RmuC
MNLNLSEQQQLLAILILVLSMGIALGYFISRYANKKQFLKFAQDQKETVSSLNNSISYSEQLKQKIQSKEKDIAVLLERVKHLSSVDPLLKKVQAEKEHLAQQNVKLLTEHQQQALQHKERIELLTQAKEELSDRFKSLAQEILEEKSKIFTAKNEEKLGDILTPLKEQISGFRKRVDEVYDKENEGRASLKQELKHLRDLNTKLSDEAANLTKALKGDKKAQGTWGELILEKVLEQSGLRNGIEYETQGAYRDEDNKLFKPDFIIHLPENKDVVVDSKVSLIAYEQFVATEDEAFLKDHVKATRNHIDGLSKKDYSNLKGVRSLDYVLMFMPIEPAFIEAVKYDGGLFDYAFQRKIVLVTPTTLLAILKTIESIWRYEKQNVNARKIADSAKSVYDKLTGFVGDMEKIGKQLSTVNSSYDNAMSKLTTGRGNLISLATRFTELGVKVKKALPDTVVEDSGAIVHDDE